MSGILSGIKWPVCLILILAVGSMISVCSRFSAKKVESVDPKHVSKNEENKSIVRYFLNEVVGQGNQDAVKVILAPDCRYFDAGRVKTTNVPEFIDYLKKARMPFESIKIEIDNIVAEGNRVAVRYSYHSVLAGELIVVPAMADFLIEDGKIVEMWRYIPARK
ncbi:MAG: nuclear transport factor 2 family protein [Syntrophaceae bacterium]|nr:nuclear transport factor 2 family protein [Syntrophaceae bacterium]